MTSADRAAPAKGGATTSPDQTRPANLAGLRNQRGTTKPPDAKAQPPRLCALEPTPCPDVNANKKRPPPSNSEVHQNYDPLPRRFPAPATWESSPAGCSLPTRSTRHSPKNGRHSGSPIGRPRDSRSLDVPVAPVSVLFGK